MFPQMRWFFYKIYNFSCSNCDVPSVQQNIVALNKTAAIAKQFYAIIPPLWDLADNYSSLLPD